VSDIVQAAREYRERGYSIVFLHGENAPPKKWKTPIGERWNFTGREPEDYRPGNNLGIVTGRLSGDLVCIDLDSEQANMLADEYLPPTPMVEGRPGKPRSHRWYRVTDIPPELTSREASGGIGGPWLKRFRPHVDFLGTGGQAAVPPSLHSSGEVREWENPGAEPATIPMSTLWDATRQLAIACGWVDGTARAASYIGNIRAVSGQGGHDATFRAASTLVNDFSLEPDEALPILAEWNETNADPPWTRAELEHKIADAAARAGTDSTRPRGSKVRGAPPERAFNDPVRLAASFPGTWRWWHEGFYHYDGTRYVAVPDGEVRAHLRAHLGDEFERAWAGILRQYEQARGRGEAPKKPKRPQVSASLVNEVLAELQSRSLVSGTYSLPCMLPDGSQPHLLPFTNGLLDVETGELRSHTPDWFSTVCIPYPYDPTAVDEVLPRALGVWFAGDAERIALAQEWAGYLLTRSTDAQAYMMLTGDGGNGKGAYAAAIEALLGPDNISYLPWEALGERFQLAQTLGKLLNVSDDIGEFNRSAEGTLKWYVGGKPMTFEEKGKDPFTATPTARLMLACNLPPRIADRTDGVWRRMLVLPFDEKIREKVRGMDKAEWWAENANMPGVLNWALAGLRRLRENGWRFTRPRRSEEKKEELRRDHNPALEFLTGRVVADPEGRDISSDDLRQPYLAWCAANGYQPLASNSFAKVVNKEFGAVTKDRKVKGKSAKYWFGLRWYDPKREGWYDILSWLLQRGGGPYRLDTETGEVVDCDGCPVPTPQEVAGSRVVAG
jgi:P4 family phage/plasmid primase-like protien